MFKPESTTDWESEREFKIKNSYELMVNSIF